MQRQACQGFSVSKREFTKAHLPSHLREPSNLAKIHEALVFKTGNIRRLRAAIHVRWETEEEMFQMSQLTTLRKLAGHVSADRIHREHGGSPEVRKSQVHIYYDKRSS